MSIKNWIERKSYDPLTGGHNRVIRFEDVIELLEELGVLVDDEINPENFKCAHKSSAGYPQLIQDLQDMQEDYLLILDRVSEMARKIKKDCALISNSIEAAMPIPGKIRF